MKVQTIQVVRGDKTCIINECDFDPNIHVLVEAKRAGRRVSVGEKEAVSDETGDKESMETDSPRETRKRTTVK